MLVELKSKINFVNEFSVLAGQGNRKSCFNKKGHSHGDANASLSFDPKTGAWKCHVCGIKGDVFTFYQMYYSINFAEAVKRLSRKYGVEVRHYATHGRDVTDSVVNHVHNNANTLLSNADYKNQLKFLEQRYCLSEDTVRDFKVGFDKSTKMYTIPVYTVKGTSERLINVRSHDAMRLRCQWTKDDQTVDVTPKEVTMAEIVNGRYAGWKPVWKRGGKVVNINGHGQAALFNGQILESTSSVYVLGGEFKVMLFSQGGIPAVCSTSGEGGFPISLVDFFSGKSVRVLFDADPEKSLDSDGLSNTDRHAKRVAEVISEYAEHVEYGVWPAQVKAVLPPGGDVNDLCRILKLDKNTIRKVPDMIEWRVVRRESVISTAIDWENSPLMGYNDLISPSNAGRPLMTQGTVAAVAETSLVPGVLSVECQWGYDNNSKSCMSCGVMMKGCSFVYDLPPTEIVRSIGKSDIDVMKNIRTMLQIPKGCNKPKIDFHYRRIAPVSVISEVGKGSTGMVDAIVVDDSSSYDPVTIGDNVEVGGIMIPSPVNGKQQMVVMHRRSLERSCFQFDPVKVDALKCGYKDISSNVVSLDLQEMVNRIRGAYMHDLIGINEMLLCQLIAFFMPFQVQVNDVVSDRIIPSVFIFGDTNTAKTTIGMRLRSLFDAMGLIRVDQKPTFAGLIGGVDTSTKPWRYILGTIPLNDNRGLIVDEFVELSPDILQGMVSWFSSGVAERTVVGGTRQHKAWTRMLMMSNPRMRTATKTVPRLTNDATTTWRLFKELFPSPQLIGRMDLVHVQHQISIENMEPGLRTSPMQYTEDNLRSLLGFAWTRTHEHYKFEDENHLSIRASDIAKIFGGEFLLLLPVQARWKIAKIASAIATMLGHIDGDNVIVTKAVVDWTTAWIVRKYASQFFDQQKIAAIVDEHYFIAGKRTDEMSASTKEEKERINRTIRAKLEDIKSSGRGLNGLPDDVVRIAMRAVTAEYDGRTMKTMKVNLARFLVGNIPITRDDFLRIFGRNFGDDVLSAMYSNGLIKARGRDYVVNEDFNEGFMALTASAVEAIEKKKEKKNKQESKQESKQGVEVPYDKF